MLKYYYISSFKTEQKRRENLHNIYNLDNYFTNFYNIIVIQLCVIKIFIHSKSCNIINHYLSSSSSSFYRFCLIATTLFIVFFLNCIKI